MDFRVIIPVRYKSERIPGKPLQDIAGKPMIQHVYERAVQSGAESVVIATDSEKVQAVAEGFGAAVCMTSSEHESGTERLAEAVVALGYDDDEIIVNVQGDEPLVPPVVIHQIANNLIAQDNLKVATLREKIECEEDIFNPNIVKVVTNKRGYALYFSRAPLPWEQGRFIKNPPEVRCDHYRAIGIYAYRVGFLHEYMAWERCDIEEMEYLEQLRILWNCGRMHVDIAKEKMPIGVDTEEDLLKVRAMVSD